MSVAQQRAVVAQANTGGSVQARCQALVLPRSSFLVPALRGVYNLELIHLLDGGPIRTYCSTGPP